MQRKLAKEARGMSGAAARTGDLKGKWKNNNHKLEVYKIVGI